MPSKPTDWAFLALRAKLATTSAISLSVIARVGSITRVIYSGVTVENRPGGPQITDRSEEHTSDLQSLMRISYAVLCLKKKKHKIKINKQIREIKQVPTL